MAATAFASTESLRATRAVSRCRARGRQTATGFDDVIIGASRADPEGKFSAGAKLRCVRRVGGPRRALDLSSLDGSNGFRIDGIDAGDLSACFGIGRGDVNGDGIDDFLSSARKTANPDRQILCRRELCRVRRFGRLRPQRSTCRRSMAAMASAIDGIDAFDRSGSTVSAVEGRQRRRVRRHHRRGAGRPIPTAGPMPARATWCSVPRGASAHSLDLSALDGNHRVPHRRD